MTCEVAGVYQDLSTGHVGVQKQGLCAASHFKVRLNYVISRASRGSPVLVSLCFPVEEAEENALWLIIITVLHFLGVSVLGC